MGLNLAKMGLNFEAPAHPFHPGAPNGDQKMKPIVFKVQYLKEANELAMDETLPPRWKTESLFSRFESSVFLTCSEMDIALGPQCE